MFQSFYLSRRWLLWAFPGAALILFSTWYKVELDVRINEWFGDFYNLIQKALSQPKAITMNEYMGQLATFGYIARAYPVNSGPSTSSNWAFAAERAGMARQGSENGCSGVFRHHTLPSSRAKCSARLSQRDKPYIAGLYVTVAVFTDFFIKHYVFRWRTAMNDYYAVNWHAVRGIEGASQRVQEDTMRFARLMEKAYPADSGGHYI